MTPQLAISILFGLLAAVIWVLLALWSARRPKHHLPIWKIAKLNKDKVYIMTAFGWREK
jgi:hypothetical protein